MPKQIRTATKLQWLYNSWAAEIKILKDTDLKKKYKRKNRPEYVYTGIWLWLVSTWNDLYIFFKIQFLHGTATGIYNLDHFSVKEDLTSHDLQLSEEANLHPSRRQGNEHSANFMSSVTQVG